MKNILKFIIGIILLLFIVIDVRAGNQALTVNSSGVIVNAIPSVVFPGVEVFTNAQFIYNIVSVTNSPYQMQNTNTIIQVYGTNQIIIVPTNAVAGQIFTILSANDNGSSYLTNILSTCQITSATGHTNYYFLGGWNSSSNQLTILCRDGTNF
jgi:hypothetical protein